MKSYEMAITTANICKSFSELTELGYKGPAKIYPHECGHDYSRDSSCNFYSGLVYNKLLYVFTNKVLTYFPGMYRLRDSSLPYTFTEFLSVYRSIDVKGHLRSKDSLISEYDDATEFGLVAAYASLSPLWEITQEAVTTNIVQQYTITSALWGSFLSLKEKNPLLWKTIKSQNGECCNSFYRCLEVANEPVSDDLNDSLCCGSSLDMSNGLNEGVYYTTFLLGNASQYSDYAYTDEGDDDGELELRTSLELDSVLHSGHLSPYLDLACITGDILLNHLNEEYHFFTL